MRLTGLRRTVVYESPYSVEACGGVTIRAGPPTSSTNPLWSTPSSPATSGGAALDVFQEEPLAADSPFWAMPNVLVCAHSAGTSDRENERITDIFCENLRRYLAGEPLVNVLDTARMY